jgi:hypothetical protein
MTEATVAVGRERPSLQRSSQPPSVWVSLRKIDDGFGDPVSEAVWIETKPVFPRPLIAIISAISRNAKSLRDIVMHL